jgi:hypothetical protein
MKKIMLSIFALGTLAINAQDVTGFSKGNVALTTGLAISNSPVTGGTTSGFSISPSLMYMTNANWGIMGGFQFNSASNTPTGGTSVSRSNFGLGAGARYFFTPANRLSFYLGGGASATFGEDLTSGAKSTMFGLNFQPGVNYFVHKNWAMGANFNLANFSVNTPDGGDASTSFNVNPNTGLGGLNFTLMYVVK